MTDLDLKMDFALKIVEKITTTMELDVFLVPMLTVSNALLKINVLLVTHLPTSLKENAKLNVLEDSSLRQTLILVHAVTLDV